MSDCLHGMAVALPRVKPMLTGTREGFMERPWVTVDGNDAAANIAYQLSDVSAI